MNNKTLKTDRHDLRIVWLTSLAITIYVVEATLPSPLPGVKPGLANIVTLFTLYYFGFSSAVWVSLLRVLAGSLLLGTFLSPAFFLSLSGACCSLLVLALTRKLPLSLFGLSLLASLAHMLGQFFTAYFLFIPHSGLFHLLPILMTAALVFGLVSGTIAHATLKQLKTKPISLS
ncbi:MAG: Gx transporter family protein [Gammaproteobacteria bacterium]|nr:Gx transporter family protein [Gammaproteobacteria bacterium]